MWYLIVVFCLSISDPNGSCLEERDVQFNKEPVMGCATNGQSKENEKVNNWIGGHPGYMFHGWKCSGRPLPEEQDGI